MANEQNLIPWNKRTESEQREYAKKGGQKSGEVRRQRKAMKEQIEMLLSLPFKQQKQLKFIEAICKTVALRAKEFILKYVDNLTDEMRKENDIKINSSINNDDSHVVNG